MTMPALRDTAAAVRLPPRSRRRPGDSSVSRCERRSPPRRPMFSARMSICAMRTASHRPPTPHDRNMITLESTFGCACGRPHPRAFLIGIRRSEVCLHLAQLLTAAPCAESRCHANTMRTRVPRPARIAPTDERSLTLRQLHTRPLYGSAAVLDP
jgi:hypothetical protein